MVQSCNSHRCESLVICNNAAMLKYNSQIPAMIVVYSQVEKRLFTNFHRQLFCTHYKWGSMTMADIRKLEDETKAELDRVS